MQSSNLVKGIAAQTLIFFTNLLISFVYTPYLLSQIGAEAYAFFPLSFNIINYASVLTVIFTAVLAKYITVDYQSGNHTRMNEFFSSSLWGNFILGIAVGIPLLIGSLFADRIFKIPVKIAFEVKVLFIFVTASFFIIQIRNTFIVANITTNKRYLTSFQRFFEKLIIVALPVSLFVFLKPSVVWLGIAVFIAVTVRLFVTVKTQKKIMPELVFKRRFISKKVTKIIMSGGLWHSFNQLVILLNTNVEILLANLIFGPLVQSEYVLAIVIPNLIRSMTIYITNRILPFLALLFKNESYIELRESVPRFIKCMSVFMGAVTGLVIGFGDVFLSLWLPELYSVRIYILTVLSMLSVFITGSFSVLYSILVVHDKLKAPAFTMLILGVINIPVSVFLSRFFGIFGILISSLVINIAGYMLFIPLYLQRIVRFDNEKIYPSFLKGVFVMITGIAFCMVYKLLFKTDSIIKLIIAVLTVSVLIILTVFIKFLRKKDIMLIIDSFKTDLDDRESYNELI